MNDLHAIASRQPQRHEIEDAFQALKNYAAEHFALEEQLMAEVGIDADNLAAHKSAHAAFVDELSGLWSQRDQGDKATTEQLLEFLTTWIYRHILITDHAMARDYYQKKGLAPPPSLLLSSGSARFSGS
jgi:hemerythrin